MSDYAKDSPELKAFIELVISEGRKIGVSLSHQDGHGAFIVEPYSESNADWLRQAVADIPAVPTVEKRNLLSEVTTRDRFGLVLVHGEPYEIVDIGMRMLQPHELFAAQGFPADYQIAPDYNGKPLTKTAQTRLAGNSVCPPVARALVVANMGGDAAVAA